MRNSTLEIRPVTEAIGAEILNIDLGEPQPEQTWQEIRQAFSRHGVIFFRNQRLSPGQQIAFSQKMGRIALAKGLTTVPGFEQLQEIRKEPEQKNNIGGGWHTDQSFLAKPTRATILLAREVPQYGGDTLFISMAKVYESLSEGLKRTLQTLRAIHSTWGIMEKTREGVNDDRFTGSETTKQAIHPVVAHVPESGRKFLFVNPSKTRCFEGWTEEESAPLLQYLYQQAQKPEFGCRFRWTEGAMAMWDNYQTWHYAANDYDGELRLMHRSIVEMEPFY